MVHCRGLCYRDEGGIRVIMDPKLLQALVGKDMPDSMPLQEFERQMKCAVTTCGVVPKGEEEEEEWWIAQATTAREQTVTQFYLSKDLRDVCGGACQAGTGYAHAMIVKYVMEKGLCFEGGGNLEPGLHVVIHANLQKVVHITADETAGQMAGDRHEADPTMPLQQFKDFFTRAVTECH